MRVRVLAFATASDALGGETVEVALAEGGGLAELRRELAGRFPALEPLWPRLAIAVDGEIVSPGAPLHDGAEVALLPPVSGGGEPGAVALVDGPLDVEAVCAAVAHRSRGALLLFVGTVRDHHRGRTVEGLTYTAYRPMALRALERIVGELEAGSAGLRLAISHRLGEVPAGEASVVIAAASPHRDAAYRASRTALERLKREVPIWKRERYAGGEAAWREEEPLALPRSTSL